MLQEREKNDRFGKTSTSQNLVPFSSLEHHEKKKMSQCSCTLGTSTNCCVIKNRICLCIGLWASKIMLCDRSKKLMLQMLLLNQSCTIYEAASLIRLKFKLCWKQPVHKKTTARLLSYSKHRKLNQKVCHKSAELHASPHVRWPSAPVTLPHQSLHAASRKSTLYWCNAQDCGAAWTIGCHRAPAISTATDSIKPLNLDTSLKNIIIFSVALSILYSLWMAIGGSYSQG